MALRVFLSNIYKHSYKKIIN